MTTKAELVKENLNLIAKCNLLQGRLSKRFNRQKLAGLYLQCIRLMPDYTNKYRTMQQSDFDRVLSILEQDEFPEGF